MKRILTITAALMMTLIFLSGCSKRDYWVDDRDYWLSKERALVVYADNYCPYFIVETYSGYSVIRANGIMPYEGSVLHGDFNRRGYRDFYSRSTGGLYSGQVIDYWLSYSQALFLIDDLCYY